VTGRNFKTGVKFKHKPLCPAAGFVFVAISPFLPEMSLFSDRDGSVSGGVYEGRDGDALEDTDPEEEGGSCQLLLMQMDVGVFTGISLVIVVISIAWSISVRSPVWSVSLGPVAGFVAWLISGPFLMVVMMVGVLYSTALVGGRIVTGGIAGRIIP